MIFSAEQIRSPSLEKQQSSSGWRVSIYQLWLKNLMFYLITDEPIFIIADMPHLIKKIVNALEMSSFKKVKKKYEIYWMST